MRCFTNFFIPVLPRLSSLVAVIFLAFPHAATAQSPVYNGIDGYLAVEAEAAFSASLANYWQLEGTVNGASEGMYLRTRVDRFNRPGHGVLNFDFTVDESGPYQFAKRSRIGAGNSNTDRNDTWVRLLNSSGNPLFPIDNNNVISNNNVDSISTGRRWLKSYQNTTGQWRFQASNRDNVGRSIGCDLVAGVQYSLQISARSEDLLLDRLYLWNRDRYDFANEERGFQTSNSGQFNNLVNSVTLPVTLLGDVNLDTTVNFLDIAPFIGILSSNGYQDEADIDGSGAVDFLDISHFIVLLSGSST